MSMPTWYPEVLDASRRIGSMQVFFVVGCQKSGTTWLTHLLDGHPRAACGGEGHLTDVLAPLMLQAVNQYTRTPKTNGRLDGDDIWSAVRLLSDRILCGYLRAHPDRDPLAVGDKTPEGAMSIAALDRLYPSSRVIHIIRDGRDGAVSGWAHLGRTGKTDQFESFADYAEYFADAHWTRYIRAARGAARAIGDRYLEVRYESLHGDAVGETRRILEFLGLPATDEMVDACVAAGSFERLSGGRARGDEQADSRFRKGIVGDWRNGFDEAALARFDAAGGELLRELGYADGAVLTS